MSEHGKLISSEALLPRSCIVCGEVRWAALYSVLQQCQGCGFIRADMDVDDQEITSLYQEEYFRGREYGDYLGDREAHWKNCVRRFEEITKIAGELRSFFEIGCAYGFWLQYLTRRGVQSAGIDICTEAVNYAVRILGQRALLGDFLSFELRPGQYQAFGMWDTIEHLAHPALFMQKIFQSLPPGGWFFATTGDIGSHVAKRQGHAWRMIHPPTHLQYFSGETLRRFLQRQGFDVVAIQPIAVYRSLHGVLNGIRLFGRGVVRPPAWLARTLLPVAVQRRLGFWLDLKDIILISARKPMRAPIPCGPGTELLS